MPLQTFHPNLKEQTVFERESDSVERVKQSDSDKRTSLSRFNTYMHCYLPVPRRPLNTDCVLVVTQRPHCAFVIGHKRLFLAYRYSPCIPSLSPHES